MCVCVYITHAAYIVIYIYISISYAVFTRLWFHSTSSLTNDAPHCVSSIMKRFFFKVIVSRVHNLMSIEMQECKEHRWMTSAHPINSVKFLVVLSDMRLRLTHQWPTGSRLNHSVHSLAQSPAGRCRRSCPRASRRFPGRSWLCPGTLVWRPPDPRCWREAAEGVW